MSTLKKLKMIIRHEIVFLKVNVNAKKFYTQSANHTWNGEGGGVAPPKK